MRYNRLGVGTIMITLVSASECPTRCDKKYCLLSIAPYDSHEGIMAASSAVGNARLQRE